MTASTLACPDAGLEGGQIGVAQIAFADLRVEVVAIRLGAAVDGIVLGRGHHLQIVGNRRPAGP